jgi:hypothetical protein
LVGPLASVIVNIRDMEDTCYIISTIILYIWEAKAVGTVTLKVDE